MVQMPIRDELTTEENPIKMYVFGWEHNGKRRGYGRFFRTIDAAVKAAEEHRSRTGKTGHHVIGRAIAGFAF